MRQFIMADIAGFPLNKTHGGSWKPTQSFRLGYGRELVYPLELRVFAEYSMVDFDAHDGMTYQSYSRGHRQDFALYPALVAFGIVEAALGGYYSIQDQVYHRSGFPGDPYYQLTVDPVKKKFGIYVHLGVGETIHIIGPVDCSLGIFVRKEPTEGRTYFGARAGAAIEM